MACLGFLAFLIFFTSLSKGASAQLADSAWPHFHGDIKNTGQSKYDTSKVNGSINWRFKTEGQIETSPVIGHDGTIYIFDQKCLLYAIDSKGKEKWRFDSGDPISSKEWGGESCAQSTPAVARDGTIYILPMTGNFFAINPDGTEKWRYPIFIFKNAWASPAIALDGTIYVGSELYPPRETGRPEEEPGFIYALNPNGSLKWSLNTKSNGSTGTPAIADDGTLFTTSEYCESEVSKCKSVVNNVVIALDPSGKLKWTFIPPNGVPEGSPAIGADGTVYVACKGDIDPRDAFFYALNPEDGTVKWKYAGDEGESVTPGIAMDGTIYFGDWGGKFFALNSDGTLKWSVQTPKSYEALSSSPAIGAEGTIYFGSTTGQFFAYTKDGKEKWQTKFDSGGIVASPAIGTDGTVYITTVPGELIAFGEGKTSSSNASDASVNKDDNNKNNPNLVVIIMVVTAFLLLIAVILTIIFRWKKLILISLMIAFFATTVFTTIVYFSEDKKPSNNSETSNSQSTNQSSQPTNQSGDQSKNEVGDSADCPHHLYGTWERGFYGAYGMTTKDLTTEESKWVEDNCPNTTWPQQYWKK